jgi:hypothetical protein
LFSWSGRDVVEGVPRQTFESDAADRNYWLLSRLAGAAID